MAKSKKMYVFQRVSDGAFYSGFRGKFSKNIKDAHIYVTEKTALHNINVTNYDDLELCEIEINIKGSKKITHGDFELADNYGYRQVKKHTN